MHDGLAGTLAKSAVERVAVVLGQEVLCKGLTTVLVHSLQDLEHISILLNHEKSSTYLVGSGISETREQREEAGRDRGGGLVLEDDGVQLRNGGDLGRNS